MNTDEGRAQREEAKAKYLASLSKAKSNLANLDFTPNKNLTIQEQVDMIMSELQLKQKKRKSGEPEGPKQIHATIVSPKSPKKPKLSPKTATDATPDIKIGIVKETEDGEPEIGSKKARAKHQMNAVYGSSSKATKTRRCGECEGCMRDDCGQCAACADKPRFGGRGSKKKACMSRTCRMRGPAPQGQPVAINLQEGQTYQIMGYLDGDKAVVKPVQTPVGETEVQNEHQNAQEVHQNAQEVHQNAQEVHQNAQEEHQNAQEVHQNAQEVHQNAQEVHQNAQDMHQNAQDMHQNAQEVHLNAQEVHQNAQEVHQNAQEQEATSWDFICEENGQEYFQL